MMLLVERAATVARDSTARVGAAQMLDRGAILVRDGFIELQDTPAVCPITGCELLASCLADGHARIAEPGIRDCVGRILRGHVGHPVDEHVAATKTAAGERVVPMFGSARLVLLEQKARSRWSRPHDLVFPTAVGTPQNPATSAEREFRHALRRAGLPRLAFRFHDLRHYAVSQLIAQGASILQVARVAGHADPSVTLRVYGHLMADGLAEAARRYDPLRALAVDER